MAERYDRGEGVDNETTRCKDTAETVFAIRARWRVETSLVTWDPEVAEAARGLTEGEGDGREAAVAGAGDGWSASREVYDGAGEGRGNVVVMGAVGVVSAGEIPGARP